MAQQVADILGCDLATATSLFEASGGSVEFAIEMGMGAMGDGGDTAAAAAAAVPPGFTPPYPHYQAIWPEAEAIRDAWQEQRLDAFSPKQGDSSSDLLLLVQDKNGPCGVLAVVQAELWLISQQDASNNNNITTTTEDRVTQAISNILRRVMTEAQTDRITLADASQLSLEDAAQSIRTAAALVEAVASTAGIGSKIARMTPLVEGPHWLCSSDLMTLLLRGNIGTGSFAAYDMTSRKKVPFYTTTTTTTCSGIGMLSMMELDDKIPVADDLKFDKTVWVLHTGDHFVTMRRQPSKTGSTASTNTSTTNAAVVVMEIYDGLKPNGPITKVCTVQGNTAVAPPAPEQHVESFAKKRTGQPDDLVQAKKTDSPNYQDWTFEVVPAVDDPDVQGPLDEDPNEPAYDFQSLPLPTNNWRCGSCYSNRFKTMNFGTNPAGTTTCEVCKLQARDAMWSLWLSFPALTPRMQRRARIMYAPKLELILSTLYPHADIQIMTKEE